MRWFRIALTTALLAFVAVSLGKAVLAAVTLLPTAAEAAPEPEASAPVVAYYFHATKRCATCRAIEENGRSSLAAAVGSGRVEWRVANYEEAANAHFAKEFDLEFASLVQFQADSCVRGSRCSQP